MASMEATRPVVDHSRCEEKGECVAVCPLRVFEVRRSEQGDFTPLSSVARMKKRAHGRRRACAPGVDECRVCGLCVPACPERAIRLARR